ncbi:carbohydrate-binding protein [Desulfotruncus alcoholivorax]|uniref:carbohydrate-binding protein n=1 Tax=Desulfotruncus alcoholivorax TaxID=265477 RepID=UPI0004894983|nr:carbohydrate-binding protein [Desulfotruncus alcoholivorax]
MSTLSPFTFSAAIQGVQVKPLTQDGQQIRVRYNGLLNQKGASQVWLHGGLGDMNEWREIKDYVMDKTSEGWEQTIELKDKQFNFCFRDSSQNWDNNNGANWIYRIT